MTEQQAYNAYMLLPSNIQDYIVEDFLSDYDNPIEFSVFLKYNMTSLIGEYKTNVEITIDTRLV